MQKTSRAIDPAPLIRRAWELISAGRAGAARPLVAALREVGASAAECVELESLVLVQEGRMPDALAALDGGLADAPDNVALLLRRAELRLDQRNDLLAADDAAAAVIACASNPRAKAMLGVALVRLGRHEEAATCLAEAVAGAPAHPGFRQALAEAQERAGHLDLAAATLRDAIATWPRHRPLRLAAIMFAMRQRDFTEAVHLADAARRDGIADATVFGLCGHALSNLGRHADASDAYGEALKLAPEDAYLGHLVRAAGALPQEPRAPATYIEAVFDGYADRFEQHLVDLGYRVPGLFRAALYEHRDMTVRLPDVLDLGCGTGLVGLALSDFPIGRLVGVDLSARMLEAARRKQIYADLRQADIEAMLATCPEVWDVTLAADVFIYFGDISALLTSIHARLKPGGLLLASFEEMLPDDRAPAPDNDGRPCGWRLCCQGRYVHDIGYVRQIAEESGLQVRTMARESLRREAGAPVAGLIAVFARCAP